ncbi:hypothetical protein EDD68_11348 [Melghiribacillus thermohalophilus]|uniref:Uncharacterized protein n=1 Tax=Melghiribacillus thermohalophilus TaxID=1324956 RepID=A0A4R3MVW5_9BACI|nr:hypothetical protein [Melghiribacillus thermohalophilus]TCT20484.1 hypothetical protein EDD68_11348 [Melghiribacillus thermohalophilus]
MYCCLLLYHETIHNDIKFRMLRSILENLQYVVKGHRPHAEISYHTINRNTVFAMGKNMTKESILQAGIYFASSDILTAIGYSSNKERALLQSLHHLSSMIRGRDIRVYI